MELDLLRGLSILGIVDLLRLLSMPESLVLRVESSTEEQKLIQSAGRHAGG